MWPGCLACWQLGRPSAGPTRQRCALPQRPGPGTARCLAPHACTLRRALFVVFVLTQSGQTALHAAAEAGHADVVRLLLAKGADPEAGSEVSRVSSPKALRCMLRSTLRCPGATLRLDARPDLRDPSASKSQESWPPLHCAAFHGHVDVVRLLLDHGADILSYDKVRRGRQVATAASALHRQNFRRSGAESMGAKETALTRDQARQRLLTTRSLTIQSCASRPGLVAQRLCNYSSTVEPTPSQLPMSASNVARDLAFEGYATVRVQRHVVLRARETAFVLASKSASIRAGWVELRCACCSKRRG